jgi:hypothetical protein
MAEGHEGQLVAIVAGVTTDAEKEALSMWARQLLLVRASSNSPAHKAREAIALTLKGAVIWPAIKIIARELKRRGWNERSSAGRFGLVGAALGMAVFGRQGAGIAALGTAIGVPLWVVLGSGAAFAGVLVDEFTREKPGAGKGS